MPHQDNEGTVGTFLTDVAQEDEPTSPIRPEDKEWIERTLKAIENNAAEDAQPKTRARSSSNPIGVGKRTGSTGKVNADRVAGLAGFKELQGSQRVRSKSDGDTLTRAKSAPALAEAPSKSKAAILEAKAFSQTRKNLKPALFEHKENNYYDGLRVTPGCGWFRGLCEQVCASNCRLTRSLLAVLDVPLVETLVISRTSKILLYNSGPDLVVSSGDDTVAEFARHAEEWRDSYPRGCPIVVHKRSQGDQANWCVAMSFGELEEALKRAGGEDVEVFQRFMPPKVNGSPSIVRVAWRDSLGPRGFRLRSVSSAPADSDKQKWTVDPEKSKWIVSSDMPAMQASELKSVPASAFRIADQLAHFTSTVFGVQLTQLVVDLLQDEDGNYLFTQVKSFTAQPQWLKRVRDGGLGPAEDWHSQLRGSGTIHMTKSKKGVKKVEAPTGTCTMCSCSQPPEKTQKRMTPKKMLEVAHHLRKRGIQLFHIARLASLKPSEPAAVCDTCWALSLAEKELMKAEVRLARSVSIDITEGATEDPYVPFGGVLSSVNTRERQEDISASLRTRDLLKVQDAAPTWTEAAPSQGNGNSDEGRVMPWRSGEAVELSGGEEPAPASSAAVPQHVLQWRMLLHINRLMEISPELRDLQSKGKLIVKMELPWQHSSPQYVELKEFGTTDNLPIQHTSVHFVFSNPNSPQPLQAFLSQSMVRCSLLLVGAPRDIALGKLVAKSVDTRELLSGSFSLESMLENVSDGFLAQKMVVLWQGGKLRCQLKLTLGLVSDQPVLSDHLALQKHLDAFIPIKPYFGSNLLPVTWTASILAERSGLPDQTIADVTSKPGTTDSDKSGSISGKARQSSSSGHNRPPTQSRPSSAARVACASASCSAPDASQEHGLAALSPANGSDVVAALEPAPEPLFDVPEIVPAAVAKAINHAVSGTPRLVAEAVAQAVAAAVLTRAPPHGHGRSEVDPAATCQCGQPFEHGAKFCRECGAERPCNTCRCGTIFLPDSVFCRKCGAKLRENTLP